MTRRMKITDETIQSLAQLSYIHLNEDQRALLVDELGKILGYMDVLNHIDTEGIEPLAYIGSATNVMRPDVVAPSIDREVLLQNAPERTEEAVVVPKIVG